MALTQSSRTLLNQYSLESITSSDYDMLFKNEFKHYFQPCVMFDVDALCKTPEPKRQNFVEDFYAVKDKEKVIGLFKGEQRTRDSYYMDVTVISPDYHRQGIYTALLDEILQYTKALGMAMVTSDHSPRNNPILIAKMRKGFFITGINVSHQFGLDVQLTYFHNKELQKAFEYRCGGIELSKSLIESSQGTIDKLSQQIS